MRCFTAILLFIKYYLAIGSIRNQVTDAHHQPRLGNSLTMCGRKKYDVTIFNDFNWNSLSSEQKKTLSLHNFSKGQKKKWPFWKLFSALQRELNCTLKESQKAYNTQASHDLTHQISWGYNSTSSVNIR